MLVPTAFAKAFCSSKWWAFKEYNEAKWVLDGDKSNDYQVTTLHDVNYQAKTKTILNMLLGHLKQIK